MLMREKGPWSVEWLYPAPNPEEDAEEYRWPIPYADQLSKNAALDLIEHLASEDERWERVNFMLSTSYPDECILIRQDDDLEQYREVEKVTGGVDES